MKSDAFAYVMPLCDTERAVAILSHVEHSDVVVHFGRHIGL